MRRTVLCAHDFVPGYRAVARLYEDLVTSLRPRVFERVKRGRSEWWFNKVSRDGELEILIGTSASADQALQSAANHSRAICFATELGRRLLLDGEAPHASFWFGRAPEDCWTRVDALLARRAKRFHDA